MQTTSDVHSRIIRENETDLLKINQDLEALKEISEMQQNLIYGQGEFLKTVEEKTLQTFEQFRITAKNLDECLDYKNKSRQLKMYLIGGASTGGLIGCIGFAINPIFGLSTVATLSTIGAISGFILQKTS